MDSQKTTVTRDNLFGTEYPQMLDFVTVAASQTLLRGAVVGLKTANSQALLLDKDAEDGTENFYGVLTADVTTEAAETKVAPVAIAGSFQEQALSFASGTVAADVKVAARNLNCYIQNSESANNVIGG